MPASALNLLCYEDLLAAESDDYEWPEFDENTAAGLCYTSGTTGHPKGVLFSHRSTVLHAMATCLPDAKGYSAQSVILPIVPMFHVNAWGIPYSAPLVGAKLVFPGAGHGRQEPVRVVRGRRRQQLRRRADRLAESHPVHEAEQPAVLDAQDNDDRRGGVSVGDDPDAARRLRRARHAWMGNDRNEPRRNDRKSQGEACESLGRRTPRAIAEARQAPLWRRDEDCRCRRSGPSPRRQSPAATSWSRGLGCCATISGARRRQPLTPDGWFPTGDVGSIDADGYLQITDRSKDVIKSGGEWISSIELENIAVGHPAVTEAAVIGVAHPKWNERPLLIVVKKAGASLTRDELLAFYEGKVAKWSDAGRRRVRRRAAAHGDRQAVEKDAARAIQGVSAGHRLTARGCARSGNTGCGSCHAGKRNARACINGTQY